MPNILFYTDTPGLGGAEKHMLLLAKELSKAGFHISLVYGAYGKIRQMHEAFAPYCKDIFILPARHKHDFKHYVGLKEILNTHHFDLMHLHLWNPGSARYAFFAASSSRTPIVTTEHDPFELKGFKKWIKQACLKRTQQSIVVSQDNFRLLDEYYRYPKSQLNWVPNGIEIDNFLNKTSESQASQPWPFESIHPGATVITSIAELHPRKGHKYLLEAFQKLRQDMPQLELVLVGNGPLENELRNNYGNLPGVHFLGWREDIPQILQASDIFVLPSLKEAFGQVILEAMASEVAVVATDNGGPRDLIQDGLTGHLVPPANSQAIYEKLNVLLRNPHQKKDIERAALERVKSEFSVERMAERTMEVYRKMLGEG